MPGELERRRRRKQDEASEHRNRQERERKDNMQPSQELAIIEAASLFPFEPGVATEYQRGVLELTNRVLGRTQDDLDQTRVEIIAEQDRQTDDRDQHRTDVAAEVTDALRKLYEACDGDEAQVGEIMHEVHKAARLNSEAVA
jgi:hypothetical protein